ncbi:MAG TPA: hypothetical protein EYP98_09280 [Planctomycetes bacterium]|nr:hypothetical protein [Planctomycetota bacterium]
MAAAVIIAGMVSLGIYPKQSVEQIRYIIAHSDAKVVFVDDEDEAANVLEACKELEQVAAWIAADKADHTVAMSWGDVL